MIEDSQLMQPAPSLPSIFDTGHKNISAHAWAHTASPQLLPPPGSIAALDCDAYLDSERERWLAEFTPTWTVPSIPPMIALDVVLRAANQFLHEPVSTIAAFDLIDPIALTTPQALRCEMRFGGRTNSELHVDLTATSVAHPKHTAIFHTIATAVIDLDAHTLQRDEAMDAIDDAITVDDSAVMDERTNGPSLPFVLSLRRNDWASEAVLSASHCPMRDALVHIALMDAAIQTLPHDHLSPWADRIHRNAVARVRKIVDFRAFDTARLSQPVMARIMFAGYERHIVSFPMFDVQLIQNGEVLQSFRVIDEVLGSDALAELSPVGRRTFLRDRLYVGGAGVSEERGGCTVLHIDSVLKCDVPRGTLAHAYGLQSSDHLLEIAVRDHVGRRLKQHPSLLDVSDDLRSAWIPGEDDGALFVDFEREGDEIVVTDRVMVSRPSARRHRAHRSNSRHE